MKKKNKKVNAAILIIGNEILSGRTQDKNIAFISNWLNSECGISVSEVRIVPDLEKVIIKSDILISLMLIYYTLNLDESQQVFVHLYQSGFMSIRS